MAFAGKFELFEYYSLKCPVSIEGKEACWKLWKEVEDDKLYLSQTPLRGMTFALKSDQFSYLLSRLHIEIVEIPIGN